MASSGSRGFFMAMVAVLVMLAVAHYILNQGGDGSDSYGTDKIQDGSNLTFSCRGAVKPDVKKATYGAVVAGTPCPSVDVTAFMRSRATTHPGTPFNVSPAAFPGGGELRGGPLCTGVPRQLTIDYSCVGGPSHEGLRSRNNYRQAGRTEQCLSGSGCGLGSTWIDPRFDPGPQKMYPGGDAIYAHAGHAGGPTFGSFTPDVFQTSGAWDGYVRGLGDGNYVAPTALSGSDIQA